MIDGRTEYGIRELENLFRSIKDNAHFGVWEVDLKNGNVTFSDETFRITGISPSQFDGTVNYIATEIVHEDYYQKVLSSIHAALKEFTISSMEYPIVSRGNKPYWVNINGMYINDDQGHPSKIRGVVQDITAMKFYEEALEKDMEFLDTLVEIMHSPIFYKDTAGIYKFCNSAFCDFVGLSKDEIIGSTVYEVAPKSLAGVYHGKDQVLFEHRGHQAYESQVVRSDGEIRDVIFLKAAYMDSTGKVSGLMGVILDVTAQNSLCSGFDYISFLKRTIMELDRKIISYSTKSELLNDFMSKLLDFMPQVARGCLYEINEEDYFEKTGHIMARDVSEKMQGNAVCKSEVKVNLPLLESYIAETNREAILIEGATQSSLKPSPYVQLFTTIKQENEKLIMPLVINKKLAHIIVLQAQPGTAFTENDLALANYVIEQMPLLYHIYILSKKSAELNALYQ